MLDKFLALLERFVVAHETIAANSKPVLGEPVLVGSSAAEGGADKEKAPEEKPKRTRKAPAKKDEPADEPEEATKKKPAKKDESDSDDLRAKIKELAQQFAACDEDFADDLDDDFEDLLDEYEVRSVTKLEEEDLESFHKKQVRLAKKYFDVED